MDTDRPTKTKRGKKAEKVEGKLRLRPSRTPQEMDHIKTNKFASMQSLAESCRISKKT